MTNQSVVLSGKSQQKPAKTAALTPGGTSGCPERLEIGVPPLFLAVESPWHGIAHGQLHPNRWISFISAPSGLSCFLLLLSKLHMETGSCGSHLKPSGAYSTFAVRGRCISMYCKAIDHHSVVYKSTSQLHKVSPKS